MEIKILKTINVKEKPDPDNLGFGKYFTDYMFEMDYEIGKGWHNAMIKPYTPISIEPSAMVFHYGQSVFEGLKAYISKKEEILLFRPDKNIERLNKSNERLCIPTIDREIFYKALLKLVKLEKKWIPKNKGTSLYIRPFVFATENSIGVRPSNSYKFIIILSPVGAYYSEGFNPINIFVEQKFVRAVKGGIGEAKTAGNYAASIKAQKEAKKLGFSQVLWLDGIEHKYIEEVGTMNVFFKINEEIITPELNGSILDGITRDSVIMLLQDLGYKVTQKKISLKEVVKSIEKGTLNEMFGTGTAAIISPVGKIAIGDKELIINNGEVGRLSQSLFNELLGIQTGAIEDKNNWIVKV